MFNLFSECCPSPSACWIHLGRAAFPFQKASVKKRKLQKLLPPQRRKIATTTIIALMILVKRKRLPWIQVNKTSIVNLFYLSQDDTSITKFDMIYDTRSKYIYILVIFTEICIFPYHMISDILIKAPFWQK